MYEDVTAGGSQGNEGPDADNAASGHSAAADRGAVADGRTVDAAAGGGAADEVSRELSGDAAARAAGEPVGWQRLGRARPAPTGISIYDSAGPVRGEFSETVAVNKLWRQGHNHLGGVTPVLRRTQKVPSLPDEYMAAMGWQEVQAPKADDDDDVIRAFLGPAPTRAEADALARDFGWDEPQEELYDPLLPMRRDLPPLPQSAGGAELLAHADPDPRGQPWPLGPGEQRMPVGVAPGSGGQVVDVGAIARQRIDGPAVMALESVQVERSDAYTVVEAIAAWDRIEAWAAYEKRMLARELASRPQLSAQGRVSTEARVPVATAEIAFRLGITRQGARRLIDAGAAMSVGAGMIAAEALREGEIDAAKADMVIERTAHLPAELALGVQDEVLRGDGAMRTLPQLRRAVDTAVARVDPEEFNAAHARARAKRCVGAPQKLPHGMASTRIVWSAADAMALHTALEAAARTAKTDAGEDRTLDQLRTDALAAMAHSALTTGHIGPCPACASATASAVAATSLAATTTVADCGHGQDDSGSRGLEDDRATHGDNDPQGVQDDSDQARPEKQGGQVDCGGQGGKGAAFGLTDTGGDATRCSCPPASTDVEPNVEDSTEPRPEGHVQPGSDGSNGITEQRHPEPGPSESGPPEQRHPEPDPPEPDPHEPDPSETYPSQPDPASADPEHAQSDRAGKKSRGHVCTGPGQCGPVAPEPFVLGTVGGAKAQIRITVPLSTLMGTSEEPGELEGYGPIPADVARAHAAGGTWRRLVSDPLTERTLEVTAKEYKPPGWLREQVLADAPYCVAPGCGVQSRHTDLDHGHPFPEGPTAAWNLHPVCRHHHRLKTQGHLCYHSPAEGVYEWTTPTGHRYRAQADGSYLLDPVGTPNAGGKADQTSVQCHGEDPGTTHHEVDPPPF